MSPENQIQDRYDAHDKAMNEPAYTPHIGQPYEAPPRRTLHTEAKGPQELLAEMTDQRDAAITIINQLRAERDAEREARKALAVAVSHNSRCCCRTDAGSRPCVYCTDRANALDLAAKLPA